MFNSLYPFVPRHPVYDFSLTFDSLSINQLNIFRVLESNKLINLWAESSPVRARTT